MVLLTSEIQSKDVKKYSSFLLLGNYNIVAEKIIENGKSKIIFSTTASSIEEIDDKIKSIENSKFNLEESPKIMGAYAVFK